MTITYSKPKKNEWNEWEAKAYKDGKRYPPADAFQSTKQDLIDTINYEMKKQAEQGEKKKSSGILGLGILNIEPILRS